MKIFKIPAALLFCLALYVSAAQATPSAAPAPSPKDKCPVCGMFVTKFPDWTAIAVFKDAATLFFDGAKDFFKYYHKINKYTPNRNQAMITSVTVKDYYTLRQIDARQAFYVIGSDVYGPMGKELVPFEKAADAQAFLKDHKGKKILRFNEITPAVLNTLE